MNLWKRKRYLFRFFFFLFFFIHSSFSSTPTGVLRYIIYINKRPLVFQQTLCFYYSTFYLHQNVLNQISSSSIVRDQRNTQWTFIFIFFLFFIRSFFLIQYYTNVPPFIFVNYYYVFVLTYRM